MLLENLMKLNKNWLTMQFHVNSIRDLNRPMFDKLGADTGYDAVGTQPDIAVNCKSCTPRCVAVTIFQRVSSTPWMIMTGCNWQRWWEPSKKAANNGYNWVPVGGSMILLKVWTTSYESSHKKACYQTLLGCWQILEASCLTHVTNTSVGCFATLR